MTWGTSNLRALVLTGLKKDCPTLHPNHLSKNRLLPMPETSPFRYIPWVSIAFYRLRCSGRNPGCFWGRTQEMGIRRLFTSYPFCTFLILNYVNVSLSKTLLELKMKTLHQFYKPRRGVDVCADRPRALKGGRTFAMAGPGPRGPRRGVGLTCPRFHPLQALH